MSEDSTVGSPRIQGAQGHKEDPKEIPRQKEIQNSKFEFPTALLHQQLILWESQESIEAQSIGSNRLILLSI
jgi:hypothetical protein